MASGADSGPILLELAYSEKLNYLIKQSLTQTSALKSQTATLQTIQTKIGVLTIKIVTLHTAVSTNEAAIHRCQDDIEEILQYQRRNNLVLNGVPEAKDEDLFKIFEKFTAAAVYPPTASDLDTIHRVAPTRVTNKPRPILSSLSTVEKKKKPSCARNQDSLLLT